MDGPPAARRTLDADLRMNKNTQPASNPMVSNEVDSLEIDRWAAEAALGDDEAFGRIVQTYHTRVYSVILRIVNNPEDARELSQVAWVKAWQRLAEYKREARFYTWVYRIAVNTSLDFLRRRKRRPEVPLEPVMRDEGDLLVLDRQRELADETTPHDHINRAEIRATFEKALAELSDEHRTALVLREVEGMSYDEIAEVMKTSKGTVMSRLFYARRMMQKSLEKFV